MLQLCEHYASSSYGAAHCDWLSGGCQGAYANNCYPYDIWSGSLAGTMLYYDRELKNGDFTTYNACGGEAKCSVQNAFSVRCVLDLTHA